MLALGIVGIGLVLAGIGVISEDVGSCPAMPVGVTGCYHTFAGTSMPITPTGVAISSMGAIIAVGSLVVGLLQRGSKIIR
jgi:hypothetical protein